MIDHHLIIKYFSGNAKPEEASVIENWAQESDANKEWLSAWHQAWLNDSDNYQQPNIEKEWAKLQEQIQASPSTTFKPSATKLWLTRAAAAVLFIATGYGGYYLFNRHNQNVPTFLAEAGNTVDSVMLQDGSLVLLQPHAQLAYPQQFTPHHRSATLVGDAHFKIASLKDADFIIDLGQAKIKVIGTEFEVVRDNKTIEVAVKQGKVAFYNKKDTLYLSAQQQGLFTIKTEKFELKAATESIHKEIILGSFQFNNTPLPDVVSQLNNHYHVNITLESNLLNCKFSAGIDQQPLNVVLEIIAATHHVTYKQEGGNIAISGKGCKP